MGRAAERRVLPVLAAATLACLLIGAGWAVYELSLHGILAVFEGPYVRARAVALSIEGLAAAWLAAVAFYAGPAARGPRGGGPSAARLARASVFAACLYAVLSILVEPRVVREYETMRRKSEEAAILDESARLAIGRQDWTAAAAAIGAYLAIDPTSTPWRRMLDEARSRSRAQPDRPAAAAEAPAAGREEPRVADLLALARRYMAEEDYATAFTLAARAEAIAPANREAVQLRRRAIDALAGPGRDASERAASALYRLKAEATAALGRGDPVSAYYILRRGAEAHPDDGELRDLLASAEAALARFAFFRDTLPDPDRVPPRDRAARVAFVNRREPGAVEIVFAGSVVRVPRTVTETRSRRDGSRYSARRQIVEVTLYDVEVMAFGGGRVAYHVRAPVGRLMSEPGGGPAPPKPPGLMPPRSTEAALARVALLALHRSVEEERLAPVFVAGTEAEFGRFGRPAGAGYAAYTLPLVAPPDILWTAGLELGGVRERSVVELWTLQRARPALDVTVELVLRAVRPVVLLILAALAACVARSHAPSTPLQAGSYALAPTMAAAGHLAFVAAMHAVRVAVVSLAGAAGWRTALAVLAAALIGLLVLALLAMARTLRPQG